MQYKRMWLICWLFVCSNKPEMDESIEQTLFYQSTKKVIANKESIKSYIYHFTGGRISQVNIIHIQKSRFQQCINTLQIFQGAFFKAIRSLEVTKKQFRTEKHGKCPNKILLFLKQCLSSIFIYLFVFLVCNYFIDTRNSRRFAPFFLGFQGASPNIIFRSPSLNIENCPFKPSTQGGIVIIILFIVKLSNVYIYLYLYTCLILNLIISKTRLTSLLDPSWSFSCKNFKC